MNVEEFWGMIIYILMGLTFIALFLAFLYLIYGEKEESTSSSRENSIKILTKLSLLLTQVLVKP